MEELQIKVNIRNLIVHQIQCDLTVDRAVPFTKEQIDAFINANRENIEACIHDIYSDYERDNNELDKLVHPEQDWIREYMYEHITY